MAPDLLFCKPLMFSAFGRWTLFQTGPPLFEMVPLPSNCVFLPPIAHLPVVSDLPFQTLSFSVPPLPLSDWPTKRWLLSPLAMSFLNLPALLSSGHWKGFSFFDNSCQNLSHTPRGHEQVASLTCVACRYENGFSPCPTRCSWFFAPALRQSSAFRRSPLRLFLIDKTMLFTACSIDRSGILRAT